MSNRDTLESAMVGPALPPSFNKDCDPPSPPGSTEKENPNQDLVHVAIGPSLPPELLKRENSVQSQPAGEHDITMGPQQPPRLIDSDAPLQFNTDNGQNLYPNLRTLEHLKDDSYGPALPPGFSLAVGPALPPGFQSDSSSSSEYEDDQIGPMPPTVRDVNMSQRLTAGQDVEARSAAMKLRLEGKNEDGVIARDTWMTELPEFSKDFGLGPRMFRKNARPDEKDRTGWTETPVDKARKQQEREERAIKEARNPPSKKSKKQKRDKTTERDRKLEEVVHRHNEMTRAESLMEIHGKNRKRKMEEGGASVSERRPFDREVDLNVNRFDEARRKQLMKKSAVLDQKFSHSDATMYL